MSKLILWKNQEMDKLRRDMDRLFERCWSNFGIDSMFSECAGDPQVEIIDRGEFLEVSGRLEGFGAEGLDISVAGKRLVIRAVREGGVVGEKGGLRYMRSRSSYFSRVLRLPCLVDADGASASFKNGVLFITLPKKAPSESGGVKVEVG